MPSRSDSPRGHGAGRGAVARPRLRPPGVGDRTGIGLLVALLGGALLVGARLLLLPPLNVHPRSPTAGSRSPCRQPDPGGQDDDPDIWLVALDRSPRRVIGTDTDVVDQLCPAFSPDGRGLAYGRVEGHGTDNFVNADGTEGARPAAYRQAALVVADVSDDGQVFGSAHRSTSATGSRRPVPSGLPTAARWRSG